MNPPETSFSRLIVHTEGRAKLAVLKFDRCPKAWLRDEAPASGQQIADFRWLKLYQTLPKPGGKLEQDPRFIDAVEVLEAEVQREDALRRRHGPDGQDGDN